MSETATEQGEALQPVPCDVCRFGRRSIQCGMCPHSAPGWYKWGGVVFIVLVLLAALLK